MGQVISTDEDLKNENRILREANSIYSSIYIENVEAPPVDEIEQLVDDYKMLEIGNETLRNDKHQLQAQNTELIFDNGWLKTDNEILQKQCVDLKEENMKLKQEKESLFETIPPLKRILIVMIFIDKYDKPPSEYNKLSDLAGSTTDKNRLKALFKTDYKYDIIVNSKRRVRFKDIDGILDAAKKRFQLKDDDESDDEDDEDDEDEEDKNQEDEDADDKKGESVYEGIMVFYSGHGDEHNLYLSSWNKDKKGYDTYDRTKFESYFNGENCPDNINDYKFYFIDSCRGAKRSKVVPLKGIVSNKGYDPQIQRTHIHLESNTCIMYSNPNTYEAYEVPYDAVEMDIARDKMHDEKYEGDYCSLFMNGIYNVFCDNMKEPVLIHLSDLQDKIRDKVSTSIVPISGDYEQMVGLEPIVSSNLRNKRQRSIKFACNDEVIVHEKSVRDADDTRSAKIYKLKIEYC